MKLLKNISGALALTLGVGLFSASAAEASRWDYSSRNQNVVERLANLEEYSTLVTAVGVAELGEALAGLDRVTIFAPTNAAFAKIPAPTLEALLADKASLTNLLQYHVVAGQRLSSYRLYGGSLDVLNGGEVEISRTNHRSGWWWSNTIQVNDSTVVDSDIYASNGIIHGIDTVLDPGFMAPQSILEIAAGNPDFSILAELVVAAGLDRALDNERLELTVLAPTNAAFEALGQETLDALKADRRQLRFILKNHLIRGTVASTDLETETVRTIARTELNVSVSDAGISFNDSNVILADVPASNGIIHAIDAVLVPEVLATLAGEISANDELATFKVALDAAGYTRFFDRASRYWKWTILAPNNDAFAVIPMEDLGALLEDTRTLRSILLRHIAFGEVLSTDLEIGGNLPTITRTSIVITADEEGNVAFNGAPLVQADIKASNGVLHILGGIIPADAPVEEEDEEEQPNEAR